MSNDRNSTSWVEIATFVVAGVTVVLAVVGLGFVFGPLMGLGWLEKPPEQVEFYVTQIGVPLLTFAGFLAVFLGFLSQRRQNELQEEQLRKQQSNFQKDRFESTFFQLLRTHNQIVEDIRIEQKRETVEVKKEAEYSFQVKNVGPEQEEVETIVILGRSCFKIFYSEFERLFKEIANEKGWGNLDRAKEEKVQWIYTKWFAERKSDLNHYFSHLSKLISFVQRGDVKNKEFYIELITAQMSMPEQKLFFYHINLKKDETSYRHLRDAYEVLGKYTFFEQIDPERSLIHESHADLHPEALGAQQ